MATKKKTAPAAKHSGKANLKGGSGDTTKTSDLDGGGGAGKSKSKAVGKKK